VKSYDVYKADGTDKPELDAATSSVILYKDQDGTSSRRVNGYKTAFQYESILKQLFYLFVHYFIIIIIIFFI
jgi:hypothetical protein